MSGPSLLDAEVPSGALPAAPSTALPASTPAAGRGTDALFVLGLLAIPLQVVQVGPAQPGQLWMLLALPFVLRAGLRLSPVEALTFLAFIAYATALTALGDYPRVKAGEQVFKFAVIYPGFYCVGRGLGAGYARRAMPVGYAFLAALLAFEILVERFKPPFVYQELNFAEGALHGTFKERNWIGMYFFMLTYFIFEFRSSKGVRDVLLFVASNALVTFFCQSKTIIVACGIVVLLRSRLPLVLKVAAAVVGAALYWQFFASDLSDDMIRVRIEDERGLAYDQSMLMLSRNAFGYGFGYVEAYFGQLSLSVIGLGEGTNSVFSVPLDLAIVAGAVGVAAWAVFFCGVGLGATAVLAPVAVLSLLNPLHQSEIVYFFIGMLVSGAVQARERAAPDRGPSEQDLSYQDLSDQDLSDQGPAPRRASPAG